jgi:hypothetical protein
MVSAIVTVESSIVISPALMGGAVVTLPAVQVTKPVAPAMMELALVMLEVRLVISFATELIAPEPLIVPKPVSAASIIRDIRAEVY